MWLKKMCLITILSWKFEFPAQTVDMLSKFIAKDSDLAHFLRVEYLSEISHFYCREEFQFKFFDKRPDGKQKRASENF